MRGSQLCGHGTPCEIHIDLLVQGDSSGFRDVEATRKTLLSGVFGGSKVPDEYREHHQILGEICAYWQKVASKDSSRARDQPGAAFSTPGPQVLSTFPLVSSFDVACCQRYVPSEIPKIRIRQTIPSKVLQQDAAPTGWALSLGAIG